LRFTNIAVYILRIGQNFSQATDILISPMPPEMAVIKELERGTLSMLSDLQSYKNMGINVPSLFGVIYKVVLLI
jgi:chromosome partitioning related protein ParA